MSYWNYPQEPIGGGNPYMRCSVCKKSAPAINGQLEGHLPTCGWRKRKERELQNKPQE